MSKRSDFIRIEKDKYMTPAEGATPLIRFLPTGIFHYVEPCAAQGGLVAHFLHQSGGRSRCTHMSDIEPEIASIKRMDARNLGPEHLFDADLIITNPPWDRSKKSGYLLHELIEVFSNLRPTWLLFDSDWVQTVQAGPYMSRLVATVSVGRLKWMPGTKHTGKDNCQWHLFAKNAREITDAPEHFGRNVGPYPHFVSRYMRLAYRERVTEAA
jgi:hypothetical protein